MSAAAMIFFACDLSSYKIPTRVVLGDSRERKSALDRDLWREPLPFQRKRTHACALRVSRSKFDCVTIAAVVT